MDRARTFPRVELPPIPAVLLGMLSVQGGAALAKGMFPSIGAVGTVILRIGLSALILCLFFRPSFTKLSRAQWLAVIPYGVGLGLMNLVFYLALARIPLGLAVTLEFTGPLAVAVLGSRRLLDLLWVVLAATGVFLIARIGAATRVDSGSINKTGVAFALCAGIGWALYILIGGRVSRLFKAGEGVAIGLIFATIAVLPFAMVDEGLGRLTPALLFKGFGVALLSSAVPYSLEMIGLRSMPARTFGILMSAEPAIGALTGLVFLHEMLTSLQWAAVALVICASAGSALAARKVAVAPEA